MRPDRGMVRRGGYVAFVLLLAFGMTLPSVLAGAALSSPKVTTEQATDVTTTSATLNGNLTDLGGAENATVWFRYWEQGNRSGTTSFAGIQVLETNGTFSATVGDLERNTTYVYQAYAETAAGTVSGQQVTFTTDENTTVVVETKSARNVTDTSARLGGDLKTLEGAENATVGVAYWVQGNRSGTLTRTDNRTLSESGEFAFTVHGLSNNTSYVAQAYATADGVTDTGETVNFTTAVDDQPAVTTLGPVAVGDTSATLRGNLTDLGGAADAQIQFTYWEQGNKSGTLSFTPVETRNATGTFTADVTGLKNNTTYVYSANVYAGDGDASSGQTVTFTTGADAVPQVETKAPTTITDEAATLRGELNDLGAASSATVRFAYWEQGNRDDTIQYTDAKTLTDPAAFDTRVSDLDANTTYVVVALANASDGDSNAGSSMTFTTDAEDREEREDADDGDQRGPGDEAGAGDEYGPGDERGDGDERGPGSERGQGDEYGPGDEHGPGDERGPGEEHGPGEGHGPEQAGPKAPGHEHDEDDDEEDEEEEEEDEGEDDEDDD